MIKHFICILLGILLLPLSLIMEAQGNEPYLVSVQQIIAPPGYGCALIHPLNGITMDLTERSINSNELTFPCQACDITLAAQVHIDILSTYQEKQGLTVVAALSHNVMTTEIEMIWSIIILTTAVYLEQVFAAGYYELADSETLDIIQKGNRIRYRSASGRVSRHQVRQRVGGGKSTSYIPIAPGPCASGSVPGGEATNGDDRPPDDDPGHTRFGFCSICNCICKHSRKQTYPAGATTRATTGATTGATTTKRFTKKNSATTNKRRGNERQCLDNLAMLLGFEKQANRHFITDNFGRKKVQTRIDIFERAAQRLTELMPLEANPPEGGVTNVSEVGINSVATDSGSRNSEVFEPSDDDDEEFYREDDQGQENRADELMYLFEESQKQLKRAKDDCQKLLDENALISAKLGVIDAANKHHSHTIKRLREESKFLRDDKKRLEHERDSYKAMANAAQQKIDAVARIVTPSNPAASGNGAMGVCWQHSPRK